MRSVMGSFEYVEQEASIRQATWGDVLLGFTYMTLLLIGMVVAIAGVLYIGSKTRDTWQRRRRRGNPIFYRSDHPTGWQPED